MARDIITFELGKEIHEQLLNHGKSMGLTEDEVIRMVLGQYFHISQPIALPLYPASNTGAGDYLRDYMKDLRKTFALAGNMKCPECSRTLTPDDITANKCSGCGKEI
jgi:antitoxin component of RelBE/YafQ-DinJ toxin-antitoxin module